jgi:ATP-dependent DNA helicase RecQ
MLAYLDHDGCRMEYLRRQLDDPGAEPCGRCDRCGGFAVSSDVSEAAVEAAEEQLSRPGVVLEPRKMWPTALANLGLDLKGKIADGPAEGRVVARLTDLGHGGSLRALFAGDDGPVPVPLARAVVDVLGDWKPRVEGIVHVESARRPTLTRDLAEGLSRYLDVPVVGRFAIVDPSVDPDRGAANSAQRVAAVTRRFAVEGDIPAGPLLLVDDLVVTGWTMTLAARALRQAGATEVLPLALGVSG